MRSYQKSITKILPPEENSSPKQSIARVSQPNPPLHITDNWYKAIVQSTTEGFCFANIQGEILDVNDAFCYMLGYSREELLTMKIQDIDLGFIEGLKDFTQEVLEAKKTGGKSGEVRHKCKDGRIIDVLVSLKYLDVDSGFPFCFHCALLFPISPLPRIQVRENLNAAYALATPVYGAWQKLPK